MTRKPIWWAGNSKEELREFPADARQTMGYQIDLLQKGETPDDWKALNNLGKGISGVHEIRVSIGGNAYRTAYVTKLGDYVTVLHCWQKKTQTTTETDKQIIVSRYKTAKQEIN